MQVDLSNQEAKCTETSSDAATKPKRRNKNAFGKINNDERKESINDQNKDTFIIDKDGTYINLTRKSIFKKAYSKILIISILDIMLIPELEDDDHRERDEDPQIAHAPVKFSQQLPTLKELNSTNSNPEVFKYEDIELSLLTRCLLPLCQLEESERDSTAIWTFESLLRVNIFSST